MPYLIESNPILMCVNKDLLDKEGIAVPKEGWTLGRVLYDLSRN